MCFHLRNDPTIGSDDANDAFRSSKLVIKQVRSYLPQDDYRTFPEGISANLHLQPLMKFKPNT